MSEALQEAIVYAIVAGSAMFVAVRFAWPRRRKSGCDKCSLDRSTDHRANDRRVHLTVLR